MNTIEFTNTFYAWFSPTVVSAAYVLAAILAIRGMIKFHQLELISGKSLQKAVTLIILFVLANSTISWCAWQYDWHWAIKLLWGKISALFVVAHTVFVYERIKTFTDERERVLRMMESRI
jgi:hypothetical protein|nr:MAG TPA: hypothetical protein [Caudoviricetes sp.]